jgi:hypothetical protein
MQPIRQHIGSRIFYLLIWGLFGAANLARGVQSGSVGAKLQGLGFALLGMSGFFHPTPLTVSFKEALQQPRPRSVQVLDALAWLTLFFGLVLEHVVRR